MAWLTPSEFSELYVTESATEINNAQKEECLNEAIDLLTHIAGGELIDSVGAAADLSDIKTVRFRRAQGKLAFRALLLIISARFRSGGIAETERDGDGGTTNKYLNPASVETIRASLFSEAETAIESYLQVPFCGDIYVSHTPKWAGEDFRECG